MNTGRFRSLRAVSASDQRSPCSFVGDESACTARAQFVVLPSCSCTEEAWPRVQSCSLHIARVVRQTSVRCTGHMGGSVVRVRPIYSGKRA